MLDLAEDEQEEFIKSYKSKVFKDLKSNKAPEFVVLVGAKGMGKSTLAKKHENIAIVAPDDIMAAYWQAMGEDVRGFCYDKEVGQFATKVVNALLREAVSRKYNVLYDASVSKNTQKLMKQFDGLGYDVKMKAVIGDDMQAQLNVVRRKLNFDKRLGDSRSIKQTPYPENENPLQVSMALSASSAIEVLELLREADLRGEKFEVYEFGKSEPAFISGQKGKNFEDYLDGYLEKLPDAVIYEKECRGLINEARRQGNGDLEMQLINFRNQNGFRR